MTRTFTTPQTLASTRLLPVYPKDLLPGLQRALAALADLDARFEIERDHLESWSGPKREKQRLLTELEQIHRAAREPYAMQVAELERQLAALPLLGVNRVLH